MYLFLILYLKNLFIWKLDDTANHAKFFLTQKINWKYDCTPVKNPQVGLKYVAITFKFTNYVEMHKCISALKNSMSRFFIFHFLGWQWHNINKGAVECDEVNGPKPNRGRTLGACHGSGHKRWRNNWLWGDYFLILETNRL